MRKKLLAMLLALALLCAPALAEEERIAELEARVAELEAENAELRELLSQEESARLLAARFDGGVITVSEAKAEYDYLAYYYEQLGMDPDDHEDTIKNEVLSNLTEDAILIQKAQELGVYEPSAEEAAEIDARAQASLDEMVDYSEIARIRQTRTRPTRRTAPPCWSFSPARAPRWRASPRA